MLIGITGRGGSGKTTLSKQLIVANPQFHYIEVDQLIEQQVLNSNALLDKVNTRFKDKIYTIEDIVQAYFKTDLKSKEIHSCFLEEVDQAINRTLQKIKCKDVIIDWFLLHRIPSFELFDYKILIEEVREERIKRVSKRKKSELSIFLEVDAYYTECDKSKIDLIISSIGDIEEIISKINRKKFEMENK